MVDDAAGLAWVANLGCIDLNPHPVRADDLDHPDELRVDLDPVPGVPWDDMRRVALVVREVLVDHGLTGWPKTSGSRGIHVNVRIERRWTFDEVRRAALALAREVERRAPEIATSKWWKEERHGVFIDYNQNAKDRTVASAYSGAAGAGRASLGAGDLGRAAAVRAWATSRWPRCRPGSGRSGIRRRGSTRPWGRWTRCSSCRHARRRRGRATLPGRPTTPRPRANRRESRPRERGATRPTTMRPASRSRRSRPRAPIAKPSASRSPSPTGRRASTKPLVEIARAATKEEALAGFERWKARHYAIVAQLEPADILVDSMRGRFTLWYRIRVNLEHVPEAERPPQEPLDADYDPWAEVRQSR